MNNAAPVAEALKGLGYNGIRQWVSVGAIVGMISSLLVFQYGQARVWFAMSRDGLLPAFFSRVHRRYRTPHVSTWIAGFAVAIPAGIWDIDTFADLSNIGTLFAFIVVSAGVLILRKTQPDRKRSFRVPGCPYFPILSIVFCLVLMMGLPLETWIRFFRVADYRPHRSIISSEDTIAGCGKRLSTLTILLQRFFHCLRNRKGPACSTLVRRAALFPSPAQVERRRRRC